MTRTFGIVLVAIALLAPLGCASKKFVREEVQRSEVKTDQQLGRLEGDLTQEKTRVGTVETQVTDARSRADEANRRAEQGIGLAGQATSRAEEAGGRAAQAMTRADEASGRAGQALAKADETDSRLTRLWTNRNKRQLADTVVVTFGFNKSGLDDRAQTALLDVVKALKDNPGVAVDLVGYTDSAGSADYNLHLSQRRAEAVRRFLVERGVDLHRIQSIGLGEIPAPQAKAKRENNRRVAVNLVVPAE